MSFRIDIGEKNGVVLTLVVVRNQINVLFTTADNSVANELSWTFGNRA